MSNVGISSGLSVPAWFSFELIFMLMKLSNLGPETFKYGKKVLGSSHDQPVRQDLLLRRVTPPDYGELAPAGTR